MRRIIDQQSTETIKDYVAAIVRCGSDGRLALHTNISV
jgi:hypothetical protein